VGGYELTPESWTPTFWGFFMGKYTPAFKLLVVQRYLEGSMGYRTLAEQFGISNPSIVQRWIGFFRLHGEDGLKRKRASYDAEFKLSVLQHMWDNKLSKGQAATVFNIRRHATVGAWEQAYRKGGVAALEAGPLESSRMQPEQKKSESTDDVDNRSREELLDELLHLRAEVAYLKKLDALVRSRGQVNPQPKAPQKKRK
jgi:transposase